MKEALIKALLRINPEVAKRFYKRNPEQFYIDALKNNPNYEISDEVLERLNTNLSFDEQQEKDPFLQCYFTEEQWIEIIKARPKYWEKIILPSGSAIVEAAKTGYDIPEEKIKEYFSGYDENGKAELIAARPEYIKYYKGNSGKIYAAALRGNPNYELTEEQLKRFLDSDMRSIVSARPKYIKYYQGTDCSVYAEALKGDPNYQMPEELLSNLLVNNKGQNNKDLIAARPEYIKYYNGHDPQIFIAALEKNPNYQLSEERIKWLKGFLDENGSMDLDGSIDLWVKLVKIRPEYIKYYSGHFKEYIQNFELIMEFIDKAKVDKRKFIQYASSSNPEYIDAMKIINAGNFEEFMKVKEFFENNYYSNKNERTKITNFLKILKDYGRYRELCLAIMNKNGELTEEERRMADYIFEKNEELPQESKPKELSEVNIASERFIDMYKSQLQQNDSLEGKKNIICGLLFNRTLEETKKILSTYGDSQALEKLAINNKKNPKIMSEIKSMMVFTSMMEAVVNEKNEQVLTELINNIFNNHEYVCKCSSYFIDYEEKMRKLYEQDAKLSLTGIKEATNLEIDEGKGNIPTVDLSDKQYILFAHVKSERETVDDLVDGIAGEKQNFICISAISYKNQVYFHDGSGIIFGYDKIPDESFVLSADKDLGSIGAMRPGSSKIDESIITREQKGILETSSSPNMNEYVMFREGLKAKYIILPGGREPTEEEIRIAQKHGLMFVITQEMGKEIENPKPMEYKEEEKTRTKDDIEKLKELKEELLDAMHTKEEKLESEETNAIGRGR